MSSLLTFLAAFAIAESSAPLPDSLKGLADSAEAFAHSISKLDKQTDAVVADAATVHTVASNKTTRDAVLSYMDERLRAGLPSASKFEESEKAAFKSAAAYKDADLAAKKLDLAYKHERAWVGKNATAAEETKVEKMQNASRDADAERALAKADLEKKVAEAEHASEALLEATKANAKTFEEHADELMHAARRHEAAAKRAMREAISQGRVAADAAMKERKVSEQTGEEARDISEAWAEGHEEAIERSSDRAGDDLERIYEPAKELARKSVHAAERDNEMRRKRMHRLLESSERVELVQVPRTQELASSDVVQMTSSFPWATGCSMAAVGALLVAVSRRRVGTGIQEPLLG
jgi:ElaB/YqjD/DUF883 family membrane-anchored ribosome-binding protein